MKEREILNEKRVKIEHFVDLKESGYRRRYQVVEILIIGFYLLWPVSTLILLHYLSMYITLTFGLISLLFYVASLRKIFLLIVTKNRDTRLQKKGTLFFYDKFMFSENPALREIRQYSALSRSLDVIYNFFNRFGIRPYYFSKNDYVPYLETKSLFKKNINFLVKKWSEYWIGMPIAQDVRTRAEILAEEYFKFFVKFAKKYPNKKIKILEIAGGQLQSVIIGINRAKEHVAFDYQVVSIEPDEGFAKTRAVELIDHYSLNVKKFVFISSKISIKKKEMFIENVLKKNGFDCTLFHIVVSIGLGDYYYTTERIKELLTHLKKVGQSRVMVANISGNIIERFTLHVSIQWPPMRYRSLDTWKKIILSVFGGSKIRIIQTPHKIFNIAVIE